jgi:4'-phosphopantetheinyl transferase
MELWLVDLETSAPALEALERDVPRLSADDRDRASRLSDTREQRRRLAAYMALRVVLERMGGPQTRGQRFIRSAGGKPHLRAGPSFSLSHTGSLALIGVGPSHTMGVDLEETRSLKMSQRRRAEIIAVGMGLADRPASPRGDAANDTALLQSWCRLEAYAKARGQGIARLLGEIGLRGVPGRQFQPDEIEDTARRLARGAGLSIRDLKMPAGLHGAVAHADPGPAARLRHFPAERPAIARLLPR